MATYRKRSGKWQVQVRIKDRASLSKTFPTKELARAWAVHIERQVISDGFLPSESPSTPLRELFTRYLESVSIKKKSSLSESYRLSHLSKSKLGEIHTDELKIVDLAMYRDERLKLVSSSTIRREFVLLRHIFNVASHEWGYTSLGKLFSNFRLPKETHHRVRRISSDELDALWSALRSQRNPIYLKVAELALETGMRRSELLNIKIKDIKSGLIEVETSKSGYPRLIPLTDNAQKVIGCIKNQMPNSYLFNVKPNALWLAWERARKKAGIPDIRFHDLRHEAISRMLEKGLSVAEVATISGHKDYKTLFKYAHLEIRKIALKLNS